MKNNLLQLMMIGFLAAALLFAGFLSGCGKSANSAAPNAATAAAQTWLTEIDNGDYDQSWQDAAVLFQDSITQTNWVAALEKVRSPLGNLVSRKLDSSRAMTVLPGVPAGHYVVMQFNTSFANLQPAVETVTFTMENNGQWKAAGYFIK
jgi:hypothetical protein